MDTRVWQCITCRVAVGVLTTPDNSVRRRIARQTWIADSTSAAVIVKFIVRSLGLPRNTGSQLDAEQTTHGDLLYLKVDAAQHRLRGRILALHAWLRLSKLVCPSCEWVCKADDDTHLVLPSLALALGAIRARLGDAPVLAGHVRWHTWNTRHFMHHTYFGTYDRRTASEARRAIRYNRAVRRGSKAVASTAALQRALARCSPDGPLTGCGWCPTDAECTGPFPFAVGWLISLSASLARELASSHRLAAEIRASLAVNRSWGPPMMEDIWLGSALHRFYCSLPFEPAITIVSLPEMYVFNGGWHTGRGLEFNTSFVYHNKHELPLIAEHVRASHRTPRPRLQCAAADDDASAWHDTRGTPHELAFATAEARMYRIYRQEAGCAPGPGWCTLAEPLYLLWPGGRHLNAAARINRLARSLTARETATVAQYNRQVSRARSLFRAQLREANVSSGAELMRSDYIYV